MSTELTHTGLQAQELAYAQEMARIAHEAGIIPPNTKPATISAIILAGKEMGLQPFHALRSLYFVQGRLLMSVQAQLALARRAGVKVVELKDEPNACSVTLARGDEQVRCTYSMDDARKAGLLDKTNSNWAKYPRQMLRWRAIGDALRIIAPDVLLGVYDPNEFPSELQVEPVEPAELNDPAESVEPTEPKRRVIPAIPAKTTQPADDLDNDELAQAAAKAPPIKLKTDRTDALNDEDEEFIKVGLVEPRSIDDDNPPLEELDASIKNSWLRRLYSAAKGRFESDESRREWLQQNFKKSSFTALTLAEAREAIDLLRMPPHR